MGRQVGMEKQSCVLYEAESEHTLLLDQPTRSKFLLRRAYKHSGWRSRLMATYRLIPFPFEPSLANAALPTIYYVHITLLSLMSYAS